MNTINSLDTPEIARYDERGSLRVTRSVTPSGRPSTARRSDALERHAVRGGQRVGESAEAEI